MEIVSTLTSTIGDFIKGMGSAFSSAFQSVFMNETSAGVYEGLSDLGNFLVIMLGISFGYGVIRYITGLFRREA